MSPPQFLCEGRVQALTVVKNNAADQGEEVHIFFIFVTFFYFFDINNQSKIKHMVFVVLYFSISSEHSSISDDHAFYLRLTVSLSMCSHR